MSQIENVRMEEREAIYEMQKRMKDVLSPSMYEDELLLHKFLKARDFDINKTEAMLKKHLTWRKIHQVDTFLEDFTPSPIFLQYVHGTYLGEDKEGCPVQYVAGGKIETRDVSRSFKTINYFKHWIWTMENHCAQLKEANLKTGNNASKFTYIVDFNGLQMANVTNPTTASHYVQIAQIYQDNYPERLKSFYLINAPAYYVLIYSIVKRILAAEVIRKIHVCGKTGWKKELLNVIDADVLPGFLGGNKTDPDGNPMCNTFVYHGGRIPDKYYLSKEDRTFKDKSQVKQVAIQPGKYHEVLVNVKNYGLDIHYEYEVDSKDIGFGLFFEESEGKRVEILPIHRYDTSDGTDIGSYRCQIPGKYIIVFDNTFSWISSKEVSYCIAVKKSVK